MSQTLRRSITWAKGQRPSNAVRGRYIRILVDQFTQDPSLPTHGAFVTGLIKNTLHSSNSDARKHITLRLKTAEMISRNRSQIVHIYSKNDEETEYDGFAIFPERDDQLGDGTPGEALVNSTEASSSLSTTKQKETQVSRATQQPTASSPADSFWDGQYYVSRLDPTYVWNGVKWIPRPVNSAAAQPTPTSQAASYWDGQYYVSLQNPAYVWNGTGWIPRP